MIGLAALAVQILAISMLFWQSRSATRGLRLALRREVVCARSLATLYELLRRSTEGTLDEDELQLGLSLVDVGLHDELHAQTQVGTLTRIPRIGEPWPDSMIASVLGEAEA